MQIAPEVIELEELAQRSAISMKRALQQAGVASTTYWRWRHAGKEPLTGTIRKIRAAITELAERAA
jgi:hypothetical protein